VGAWRLLLDPPGPGAWNMGVDEALLEVARRGGGASLRLYRWQGPWLSLGYAQRLSARQALALAQAQVGVVRRATGGRAVLHGADLTYCVAAPESALPAGLRATYALLSRALELAMRELGVAVERVGRRAERSGDAGFDCFAAPAHDELCARGRKLVGSAQRRARGAVLQHGSIRLEADPPAAALAAGLEPGVATSLREEACSLPLAQIQEVVTGAFARVLEVRFERAALTAAERAHALARGPEPGFELAAPGRIGAGVAQEGGVATDQ